MKIRQGFISNSSSSSFVLAIKKDPTPFNGLDLPNKEDFLNFIQQSPNEDTLILAGSKADFLKYIDRTIEENREWSSPEDLEPYYKMKSLGADLDPNWDIVYVEVSYHDSTIYYVMDLMKFTGAMRQLDSSD